MHRPPNPYCVLAHAIDAGDTRLAELLTTRLMLVDRRRTVRAGRIVERLVDALGLN
jgi:hypothetical protein